MQPIEPVTPPGSRVWRIVHFPLVLIVLAIVLVMTAGVLAGLAAHSVPETWGDWGHVLSAVLAALIFIAAYVVFVRWIERRSRVDEFAIGGAVAETAAGLATGAALMALIVGLIALAGGYHVVGTQGPAVLVDMLAIAIISGFTEEIVFRGLFFRLFERWLGSWAALAITAFFFGFAHIMNPNSSPFAALCIALEAGIMLGALYMLTRRLWAAIGVHAAWNFTQGGVFGIAISGTQANGLLVPRITGPDLLTGGAFGAEASLPALIVATAFGIALLIAAHRRGRFVQPSWVRRRRTAAIA